MISVLLLGQNSGEETLSKQLTELGADRSVETILIAKNRPAATPANCKLVPVGQSRIGSCIALGLAMAKGDTVLILDARCSWKSGAIEELLAEANGASDLTWFPINNGGEVISFVKNSPAGVLQTFAGSTLAPAACVAIASSLLPREELPESESAAETICQLIAYACASAENMQSASLSVSAPQDTYTLSTRARAHVVKALVAAANIEEAFPAHDWKAHGKESAAASYHSLAALFIRLEDQDSAEECLRLSDELEESPRSLALKGLIARERGEILGAVANMVSSLQQYEIRKRENAAHYSRFQPGNIEVINENLNAGLQALNKRDNERALNHFTTAVFNFDPFYNEFGVDGRLQK